MSNVSVICRCKPLPSSMVKRNENSKIQINEEDNSFLIDSGKNDKISFLFDSIIPPIASQDDVYSYILPLVKDAFSGYNGTILAYGQTGSGKTYTMNGASDGSNQGIIPRAIETIFELISSSTKHKTTISLSCLEIYQEKLFDLLNESAGQVPHTAEIPLRIRQTSLGSVWVEGLLERTFLSTNEFHQLYAIALKKRAIGSHQMNSESSRSHLCCILNLQIQSLTNGEKISSKLHLIDLAGSEMVRKTSAQGMRLNEAKFINKSLSALGNVINALTSTQLPTTKELSETHSGVSSSKHIPYRDSKLTRLLQDSLSGNSKTILLLTISLATEHLPETLSTLRFGERARKLKTKPRINVEQNDLNAYKQNYLILEKQFLSLKGTIDEMKRELEHKDRIISELRENSTSNIINQSLLVSCANCQKLEEIIHNLRKCSTSQTQSPITKVSNVSIDERAHVSDNNRSYPLSPSPIQEKPVSDETRCAVCGLNEIETEQLRQDTGESLGGFFTCDGNCGNIFHVRCAGEIGEGGQYTVPSGEWYCTTCSVLDDDQDRKILPPHVVSDGNSVLGSDETVTDSTLNSQQYLRVLSEYHKIRRERNRILNQWQHEQRLMKHRNDWRDQKEFELNQELITAKEIINKLQDDMCGQIREQKNLEKRLSDAVTELLLLKNEKLKNETASLSLVEIMSTPGPTPAPIESFTSPNTSHQQKVKNSSGSQNPYTSLNVPAVEIPKPWIKKSLKKSGSSSVQEESKSINDAPVDSVPRHNSLHRESTSSPQKGKNRLPTSPIRQHSLNSSIEVPTSTSTSLDLPSLSFSENPELLSLSTPLPSTLSTSSSKSPFNKRLINLIQIVKEETGSFAEIRKKYKERETERSLLKSRHHKINPLTEEERGSSRKQIRENIVELERRDIVGNDHDGDRSGFDQWTIFPSL